MLFSIGLALRLLEEQLVVFLFAQIPYQQLAEQIKKESPATLIVLITGSEKGVNLARNKDNPIDQVLFKPFTFAEMAETVQGLLHC
jgi:CheY-like chemotaxis protein